MESHLPSTSSQSDWLSRFLDMVPVSGVLDYRCFFGAPWRIDYPPSRPGEMPYHVIIGGTATLDDPGTGKAETLVPGDILLLPHGAEHALHDGSRSRPAPARMRRTLAAVLNENDGTGDRFDMMCGRFIVSPAHERLIRTYLPRRMIVHAAENSAAAAGEGGANQIAKLVSLMRAESAVENLGGAAMLNALSTALFALTLRRAGEMKAATGLLALAQNPRLAPALTAMFNAPQRPWTLPELAERCNMSRATFIRHFQDSLGLSPGELLMDLRMTLASNALRTSDLPIGAVADLAGYQSETAFQRAFRQHMGATPAQWRKDQARRVDDSPSE